MYTLILEINRKKILTGSTIWRKWRSYWRRWRFEQKPTETLKLRFSTARGSSTISWLTHTYCLSDTSSFSSSSRLCFMCTNGEIRRRRWCWWRHSRVFMFDKVCGQLIRCFGPTQCLRWFYFFGFCLTCVMMIY